MTAQTCPSCGSAVTARYCGNCGERMLEQAGALQPAAERFSEPAQSFAGRVRAILFALVSPPGRLTSDWLRGRRVAYLTPLSLFLWINVVFFLIQSISGLGILSWPLRAHLAADESTRSITTWLFAHRPGRVAESGSYAEIFDALEAVHAKSLVIVMVPFFAAAVAVLTIDRRGPFKRSLVFATHFFAFTLLWLSILFPIAAIVFRLAKSVMLAVGPHNLDLIITGLEAAGLAWYLYVALDTVFGLPWLRRSITVVVLIAALYVILRAYHVVVFAVTLYST